MFTWNYQYISKARLATSLEQMGLQPEKGDILIRIHTAIHLQDDAVELARFIKTIVPEAKIVGTSTSAVINRGKLAMNQCVISVTQMNGGHVQTSVIPKRTRRRDFRSLSTRCAIRPSAGCFGRTRS